MSKSEESSPLVGAQTSNGNAGFDSGVTKLVTGAKEIEALAYAFLERAFKSSYLAALADSRIPKDTTPAIEYTRQMFKQNPDLKFQLIADLQKENMAYYKAIMEAGVELRHIEGNKVSFAITRDEYLAAPLAAIEEQIVTGAAIPREVVWSTRRDVVSQSNQIFQMMWQNAMRGEARIKQLEEGVEPEVTLVIENMDRVYELGKKMNEECEQEALMILASEKTISRNGELFSLLAKRQKKLGFDIRILAPYIDQSAVTEIFPDSEWRRLEHPINVSIIIYDRRKMFITQYLDAEAKSTEKAVSTNIYTTSKATILGIISVFEALWAEAELREMERQSRKQAELLQDILTHDIRNYVQISKASAEILREQLDGRAYPMLDSIERATDSTGDLIEKTKKLAKIADQSPELHEMDLKNSIEQSVKLIIEANPKRKVTVAYSPSDLDFIQKPVVLADELLGEIFTNVLSNAVQYTKGMEVPIGVSVTEVSELGREVDHSLNQIANDSTRFWKITIADEGKGIPDDLKKKAFTRYQHGSGGSGLGLSIVHALVTRYHGVLRIGDRVAGDYTKGASVEILLPRGG